MEATALAASGWAAATGVSIFAPLDAGGLPAATCNGKCYDFFLGSPELEGLFLGAKTWDVSPFSPHTPTRLELDLLPRAYSLLVPVQPKRIPLERAIGPLHAPADIWAPVVAKADALFVAADSGSFDRDVMCAGLDGLFHDWAPVAERELLRAAGIPPRLRRRKGACRPR